MSDRLSIRDGDVDTPVLARYERTRREALRAGLGAGAGVLAAATIPALLGVRTAFAQAKDDPEVLLAAIRLEQTAVVTYGTAASSGLLDRPFLATTRLVGRQEREHADALIAALRQLGGTAPPAPRARDVPGLGSLRDQREVASFALELETMAVAAYYEAHQKLRAAALLRTTAQIMANEGQHLVLVRQALNRPPVPNAFETGQP
ncbi:MAG: ferritin-like domain-containing protein [Solirubrobacteraceae bacterium]